MTFLGWFAALVSLLTGVAMLADTYLTHGDRADLRAIVRRAAAAAHQHGWRAVDRAELGIAVRFALHTSTLVLIVASSGVCVFAGFRSDPYEVLLRCGLAVFMALQAPCPWLHWIVCGDRRRHGCTLADVTERRVH